MTAAKESRYKGGDPKAEAAVARLATDAIPWAVVAELAAAHGEGAAKYGKHNWRFSGGVAASTYFAAAMRHLIAWWEGEDIDPDSGLPHIIKAMASLAVYRDAEIVGQAIDDRPPPSPEGFMVRVRAMGSEAQARARALAAEGG